LTKIRFYGWEYKRSPLKGHLNLETFRKNPPFLKGQEWYHLIKVCLKEAFIKVFFRELGDKAKVSVRRTFLKALQQELTKILTANGNQGFVFASKPPTVVLMTGLQGSGKTTTTGKLAYFLKEHKKKKVMVVGADLQRLAAVEQLRQIASQVGVTIVADENSDSKRL